jgi:transposase-like protein
VSTDGVYLQARMEEAAECMLVLIGASPEGKKRVAMKCSRLKQPP